MGTTDVRAPTNRVNNYTQINRKIVTVTGTLEAVDKAGMKSYLAYELAKAASEMKRDMETAVMGTQIGVAGTNSVARKTAGMGAWIITNFSAGAGTGAPRSCRAAQATARRAPPRGRHATRLHRGAVQDGAAGGLDAGRQSQGRLHGCQAEDDLLDLRRHRHALP